MVIYVGMERHGHSNHFSGSSAVRSRELENNKCSIEAIARTHNLTVPHISFQIIGIFSVYKLQKKKTSREKQMFSSYLSSR
jgi:hypothetical protein